MIQVTEAAVAAVKLAIREAGKTEETACLRVRVKGGGCSGLQYGLSFESGAAPDDRVIEQDGVRFLLDPKSELYLAGTELDHTSGLNGQGFVFRNPNAEGTCGCGKSFAA
jgi:iron-sulfur cluster assembly protein